MPLNPNIALSGVQPQVQNPIQSVGALMQLKGQMSENVLRQAQAQKAQADVQTAQVAQQNALKQQGEQKTFQSTLATNGGDWNKTFDDLAKAGTVSPVLLDAIKSKHAETIKNVSLGDAEDIKLHNSRLQSMGSSIAGILQLPADQQAAAYASYRARALADPQLAQDAPQLREQWDPGWGKQTQWMGTATQQVNEAALKQKEADIKDAAEKRAVDAFAETLRKAKADATHAEQVTAGTVPITPEQKAVNDRALQTATETARHNKAEESIAGVRETREAKALALRTGGSLSQLSDSQKALSAKVAEGDMTIEQLNRLPDKEAIIAGALEINPDWTRNAAATKKAFTDPASKQSQNLGTISRIVGHIGRFEKNSDALGLSPSMLTGVSLTGTAAAVSNDAHAIAGELEKLVSGGVGSVGQVHEWMNELKSSRAGIRKAAIDEISKLIGSQYEGMQQTYKAGTGRELPLEKFVSPEGRQWMADKGIAGMSSTGMIRARDQDGKLHEAKAGTPLPPGWKAE